MRILVCGGRGYQDDARIAEILDALMPFDVLIHGNAPGADWRADEWAIGKVTTEVYPADWRKHGRKAGPMRNQQMIDEGKPDLVIAFPGGRGTADMVAKARKAGIDVREIDK